MAGGRPGSTAPGPHGRTEPALPETPPTGHERARGLVSSRESGRRVHAARFAPPDDLADVVECFWEGAWDLRGQEPHHTRLISDPGVNIVVETGDGSPGVRVVGVWTRLWERTLSGRGRVSAVKLRPGAVQVLVRGPAAALSNRIVPLYALRPAAARALAGAGDVPPAPAAVAEWVRRWRRVPDDGWELALRAARVIDETPGLTGTAALAEVLGVGERRLQRAFRAHVGATPKFLIRRRRLQEAAVAMERGELPSLARLAAEHGYSDQAHLTRDFRSVTGTTPGAFTAGRV